MGSTDGQPVHRRPGALPAEEERRLAADLFNAVWELLEAPERSTDDDDRMLHMAHASRHHWGQVGGPEHRARGEWQCSRVYAVLGHGEPALHHARRCLEICQQHSIADWDMAAAYEALARASAVGGDRAAAARYLTLARDACAQIAEDEERQIVAADLATIPL